MFNSTPVSRLLFSVLCPFLVFLGITLLAGILAYLIVSLMGDDLSFRTTFKRLTQLFLVLSIFPLMAMLKLNSSDLGFANRPLIFKQLVRGAGVGIITLLPVLITLYTLEVHVVDEGKPWTFIWLGKKLLLELLLAMLIGLVEEPIFRGILLAGLRQKMATAWAIAVSAFYYAALHFVNSNIELPAQDIIPFSGLFLLQDAFSNMFNRHYLSPFLSLFTIGVFLGIIRSQMKTSLAVCMACHACWVWQIKLSKLLFNVNLKSEYLFLVSGYDGVIGPLVTVWLGIAIIGYLWLSMHSKR
jgi:membrane protease YdiL (CAAX protease family)